MGKSLTNTKAQQRWAPMSVKHERVLALLQQAATIGQAEYESLPARIATDADALAAKQPRDAKVSREELEARVVHSIRESVLNTVRQSAARVRRDLERELTGLRDLADRQRKSLRAPKRPEVQLSEIESYATGLADTRGIRLELSLLNARMELAGWSSDELLSVLKSVDADPALRYVAETSVSRELAKPLPEIVDPSATVDQVLERRRQAKAKRENDLAVLAELQEARVPADVRAREAAHDAVLEVVERRWGRLKTPLGLVATTGQPMPEASLTDDADDRLFVDQRTALHEAVAKETIAEAAAG